ncbi:MAG: GDSL-type esterase/lipase family protein [Minicystis sp.]
MLAPIVVIEGFLRVALHAPHGYFRFMTADGATLYPPSATIPMRWGAIPYEVHTNTLGFRGGEIERFAPTGRSRILALGDSVTDGFFSDNEATYPAQLQKVLRGQGRDVEVVNAARGGGSIDREYAILRELGFPLRPELVLLTFVTNDIFDIRERSLENLLTRDLRPHAKGLSAFLLTETALGEWVTDRALRLRFRSYRAADRTGEDSIGADDARYAIPGGTDHEDNVARFRQLTKNMDGMILEEPFSPEVNEILGRYLAILGRMNDDCKVRDARLVFVYFPAYSQVYDRGTSLAIRDLLQRECLSRAIPFIDLTEPFRQEGQSAVLHLAPVDFHPNPLGNAVMARAVGDRLGTLLGG